MSNCNYELDQFCSIDKELNESNKIAKEILELTQCMTIGKAKVLAEYLKDNFDTNIDFSLDHSYELITETIIQYIKINKQKYSI